MYKNPRKINDLPMELNFKLKILSCGAPDKMAEWTGNYCLAYTWQLCSKNIFMFLLLSRFSNQAEISPFMMNHCFCSALSNVGNDAGLEETAKSFPFYFCVKNAFWKQVLCLKWVFYRSWIIEFIDLESFSNILISKFYAKTVWLSLVPARKTQIYFMSNRSVLWLCCPITVGSK